MARDHFDLSGKIAVVAGASRGIGAEIAKILGEYGAHVIACSRDAARCSETVEAIVATGGSAEAQTCHIGKLDQIEEITKGAIALTETAGLRQILFRETLDTRALLQTAYRELEAV